MNRPSTKYTFLPDKHYDSNFKIIKAFAKRVLYHLEHNLEGVQLPIVYLRIMKTKNNNNTNNTLKEKYGESYRMTNDHTDGHQILTRPTFTSNINTDKVRKSIKFADLFRLDTYKPLKRLQHKLSQNGKWINLPDYEHKGTRLKMQKYFEGSE